MATSAAKAAGESVASIAVGLNPGVSPRHSTPARSAGGDTHTGGSLSRHHFIELAIRNATSSLADLRHALASQEPTDASTPACHLFDCPRIASYHKLIRQAIDVLEETKSAFKSTQLKALRQQMEQALATG